MEHLACPTGAIRPNLEIPFLSKLSYRLGHDTFDAFPSRYLSSFEPRGLACDKREALLSLVQTWLYFGTLTEYFRMEINSNDFQRSSSNGSLFLCSDHLKDLKSRWIEEHQFTSLQDRLETITRCHVLLAKALYVCDQIEGVVFDETVHLVLLSVRVLLCSLVITTKSVATSDAETTMLSNLLSRIRLQSIPQPNHRGRYWPLLMPHMLQNGWW
jgi:hypothetical protein